MSLELRVKESEKGYEGITVNFSEFVVYSGIDKDNYKFLKITPRGVELSTNFPKNCIKSISVNQGQREPTVIFNDNVRFYGRSLPSNKRIKFGKQVIGALFSYDPGNFLSKVIGKNKEIFLSIAWRYINMISSKDNEQLIEFHEKPDPDYSDDL